jgi:hypothetical protein
MRFSAFSELNRGDFMSKYDENYDRQRQALYLVSLLPDDLDEAFECMRLMSELLTVCSKDRQYKKGEKN